MKNLIVSTSPHIQTKRTTTMIMAHVLIALIPTVIASVVLFGIRSLFIIIACTLSAVLSEFIFNAITKKDQTVKDLSAVITGVLLALTLPASVPIWQCVIGSVFAIVVVKCLFGGIGCNFANPAVTARVFLLLAFTEVGGGCITRFMNDVEAGATPLETMKGGTVEGLPSLTDMLLGNRAGAIGETCALALLIGFIYLVATRVIKPHVPVIYIGTVFLLSFAINGDVNFALYQILSGGLMLGAVFMATDYVTSPLTTLGKSVFALGCGVLTVLIRLFGSYPDGVSFAILIMNILSPYIEKLTLKKPLGGVKNDKK